MDNFVASDTQMPIDGNYQFQESPSILTTRFDKGIY